MKAAVFHKTGDIRLEECELKEIGPREVMVKVRACGVCGTDVHIYNGSPGSAPVIPPVILGHEYSGEIVEAGSQVQSLAVGDRVTIDPNMFCGICDYCKNDKRHLCTRLTALGVNLNGGFAEYCIVPETQACVFPKHMGYEEAAMVEPLACCLHGIDRAEIKAGQTVAVIGGGAIGLMMLQLARLQGASFIAVSEPMEGRRKIAGHFNADLVVNPIEEDFGEKIRERLPEGVDVVIECAGVVAAINEAFNLAKRGGTILLFSVASPAATVSIRPFMVFQKELRIIGSFINPGTHKRALSLISTGSINVKPLISHTFPLNKINEAIKMQTNPQCVKVIVQPYLQNAELKEKLNG